MEVIRKKCITCIKEVLEDEELYQCDGCKEVLHKGCSNLSASEARCMNLQKRIMRLLCRNCIQFMEKLPTLINTIEEMRQELNSVKEIVSKTDKEISENKIVKQISGGSQGRHENVLKSYSEVVQSQANKEVLIVKPKEKKLHNEVKKDLINNVDPIALNVDVKMGRNLRDGGVILECINEGSINTVKDKIVKDLGNNYNVSVPKKINPKMKIVNVPSVISKDKEELKRKIVNQNNIDSERNNFKMDIIHISNEYRNRFNILIEVDLETYNKFMEMVEVNISLYKCKIFEFLNVRKCYKCCGFNHISKNCTAENQICPKCSGPHEQKNCQSNAKQCTNCLKANNKFNLNLDVNHTVWDRMCPCLIKVEKAKKNKTNYLDNLI